MRYLYDRLIYSQSFVSADLNEFGPVTPVGSAAGVSFISRRLPYGIRCSKREDVYATREKLDRCV